MTGNLGINWEGKTMKNGSPSMCLFLALHLEACSRLSFHFKYSCHSLLALSHICFFIFFNSIIPERVKPTCPMEFTFSSVNQLAFVVWMLWFLKPEGVYFLYIRARHIEQTPLLLVDCPLKTKSTTWRFDVEPLSWEKPGEFTNHKFTTILTFVKGSKISARFSLTSPKNHFIQSGSFSFACS